MKKIFYSLISGLAFAVLFGACEKFNDQFDGLDAKTKITNVAAYNYTLLDADYSVISKSALAVAKNKADSTSAKSIASNKYFTSTVPSSNYMPYLLAIMYPYSDLSSTAMITSSFGQDRPTFLSDLTTVNILANADYQLAWGTGPYVSAFTPTVSPSAKLPGILTVKFPTATNGQYKFVEYNYSSTDAVNQSTDAVYFSDDWSTHSAATSSPYTVIGENGWMSKDVLASLNWYCRTFSSNNYAQVTSNGSGAINEAWMISKEINLQGSVAPKFTFDVTIGYWNASCLSVLISQNFDGTTAGISTATWTDITSSFTIPVLPTSGYGTTTNVGIADLTAYAGKKVRIAFKYNGDGRTAAVRGTDPLKTTTYQVDNIKVSETKVALSVASTEKQYATYTFNGSSWVPAAASSFYALQLADYTSMGLSYVSSTNAPLYIPQLLSQKFPFAQEGNVKTVVYKSGSNATYAGATQYTFTNTKWVTNSFKTTKTEQFIYSNSGWVFDPTIKMTMVQSDYQLMVDYVLATPSIAKFALASYHNEEFYYGFGSRYSNVSFRLSYRNPYFSGADQQPATIDPELSALTTDTEKVALLWTRLKEGMAKFLQLRYPGAVPSVSGLDVYYHVTTYVYYPNGVTSAYEYHKYIFKCTAAASGSTPPSFEFVSESIVN